MALNVNFVTESDSFTRTTVKIPSVQPSLNLHAWQYIPKGRPGPYPVIILAHGFTGNKLQGLTTYAIAFAAAGYASLVFDYRRWGESDGKPRNVVIIEEQIEDYKTVIKYCRQQTDFDPQRIIGWGSSFSGAHVVQLAADQKLNLAAIILQCGHLGVGGKPPFTFSLFQTLLRCYIDVVRQGLGFRPVYIPVVGEPGTIAILTAPGSVEGMAGCCLEEGDYPNNASASSIFQLGRYRVLPLASKVKCPALVVSPEFDNLCWVDGAK